MYSNTPANTGFLTRLWRRLTGARDSKRMIGTQRSAVVSTIRDYSYDQEIQEYPIRDQQRAMLLIDSIYGQNRESVFDDVLRFLEADVFSSGDGDDRGFTIGDTLEDGETPIDPDVRAIALDAIRRRNGDHYVIGGTRFQLAARESLSFGDSFWQLAIERDGEAYAVTDTLKMPCWECFRVESDTGQLIEFEQRRRLMEPNPEFVFPAVKMIHFRYRRRGLYGQSLFDGRLKDRSQYRAAQHNLGKATNDTGSQPYRFIYPENFTVEQQQQFKEAWDQKTKDGVMTAFFTPHGMVADRMGSDIPNFDSLINYSQHLKTGLVPAGIPIWLIPGLETTGARDISGAPERAYVRMINDVRAVLTEGIRKAIDIELFLKLGPDAYQEKVVEMGYSVVWPKITIPGRNGQPIADDETDATGVQELDASSNANHAQQSTPTEWLHREFDTFSLR